MHKPDARAVDRKSEMACCGSWYRRWEGEVIHTERLNNIIPIVVTIVLVYCYFDRNINLLLLHLYIFSSDKEELVKISKEEKLAHTPADMTGNELDFNQKRRKKNQGSNNKTLGYDGEDGNDELGFEENDYP